MNKIGLFKTVKKVLDGTWTLQETVRFSYQKGNTETCPHSCIALIFLRSIGSFEDLVQINLINQIFISFLEMSSMIL